MNALFITRSPSPLRGRHALTVLHTGSESRDADAMAQVSGVRTLAGWGLLPVDAPRSAAFAEMLNVVVAKMSI